MPDQLKCRLGGFLLKINSDCYLVEVKECDQKNSGIEQIAEIPSWVFESKHAIWLTDDNKPIFERARQGETIRKRFLEQRISV